MKTFQALARQEATSFEGGPLDPETGRRNAGAGILTSEEMIPYLFPNPVSHENAFAFYFSLVVRFAALRRALPNVSKVAFPASVRHFGSGSILLNLFLPFALTWYMYHNPYRCSESLKKIN